MTLKRRAFLRQTAGVFAAFGLAEAGLALLCDRYQQTLAQPSRRKLALLVGINQYGEAVSDAGRGAALSGCLTDVELQRELLMHRFGLLPHEIISLTDQAATRSEIQAALSELTQQMKAGDAVLFHFSGLGSQVQLAEPESSQANAQIQLSLVPFDGSLPASDSPQINDLMLETLALLLRSLPTEQVITVIDAGFTRLGRTMQGNLRIRSRLDALLGSLTADQLELQAKLMQQGALSGLSPFQIGQRLEPSGQSGLNAFPGVLLRASQVNQIAAEAQWSGFSAGLLTYALTQQLWSTMPPTTLWLNFHRATAAVKQVAGMEQQPVFDGKVQQAVLTETVLGETVSMATGADGVVRSIDEDGKAQLWLGGLPAAALENASASLFTVMDAVESDTASPMLVRQRSRDGLIVKARALSAEAELQVGQLVQEAVRIVPRSIGLTVALDNSLERIERVDATSAFAAIPRVSSVIAGEQSADFLFGKAQSPLLAASLLPDKLLSETELAPAQTGYGLFYPGYDAIPNTLVASAEAVKTAVNRLTSQLRTLLAIKLLRVTQNQNSSRLSVQATLETLAPTKLVLQQETMRVCQTQKPELQGDTPILPVGSQIQYRLHNSSEQPVYFLAIGLDTRGNAVWLNSSASADQFTQVLAPRSTITIPATPAGLTQNTVGLVETYLVFSRDAFVQTAQQLIELRSKSEESADPSVAQSSLNRPLEIVQAILQDLHQASSSSLTTEVPPDTYALDVNAWATLSFVYQVIEDERQTA